MTHRQKKQYNRGCDDCGRGVDHKEGRGKYYDMGYSDQYAAEQNAFIDWARGEQ